MKASATELSQMSREELDALPFGAVRLSAQGTIMSYNMAEGRLSGRTPERVLGRNFFRDVAPCTDVREFHGRFTELFKEPGSLLNEFSFVFAFDPPMRVNITLLRDRGDNSVWALIEHADAPPPTPAP